jgi:hypothetical protein
VITMTGLEADALAQRGVPRTIMRRIGVGVTPAEVLGGDGARFRAEQQIAGPLVLYIGALAYDKGAIPAVQAMQRLWAQGSDATLALIGAPLDQFTHFHARLPAADQARIRRLQTCSRCPRAPIPSGSSTSRPGAMACRWSARAPAACPM